MTMTVASVMTITVASVTRDVPFHVVAEKLIATGVGALPVLDPGGVVVGMISEADLLRKEDFKERYYGEYYYPPLRTRLRRRSGARRETSAEGVTAGELMSSPAIVVAADSPVVLAARLMERHGIKRLPVVDDLGRLAGIVTRRDLLKVFLRPDADIAGDAGRHADILQVDALKITVADGVLTLSGSVERRSQADAAARAADRLDGVVAVHSQITWTQDDTAPVTVRTPA
ncbi:CBS domain-containing protein [Spongiactinospora sp. TRM90649]|uniref:CBS domain-containing protein n=1 Tax=Spongiactinospora sp. TRM90649 TaxID=3031114 RepID=UPI0023F754C5|nr:CBS domain-containing protein [Spongiactinospora sp. TRM90649]MDF5754253.1 CBS domain-containing protein [Spongiactinospora sp. TRM90649]